MERISKIIVLGLFLLFLALPLQAGTTLMLRMVYPYAGTQSLQTLQIQNDKMRINLTNENYDTAYIFRRDMKLLWLVDYRAKTYLEFTQDNLNKFKQSIDTKVMTLQNKAPLSYPEQTQLNRFKQLQQSFREIIPGQGLEYKLIDLKKPLGSWDCLLYEISRSAQKVGQIWTVDVKTLGLQPEELQTLTDLKQFTFHLSGQLSGIGNLLYQSDRFKGVVVKSEDFKKTNVYHRFEIVSVKPTDFDSTNFELPADLVKQEWQFE